MEKIWVLFIFPAFCSPVGYLKLQVAMRIFQLQIIHILQIKKKACVPSHPGADRWAHTEQRKDRFSC